MNLDERIQHLRERGEIKRSRSRWYKKWWGVVLIILASLLLVYIISFLFLFIRLLNNPEELAKLQSSKITDVVSDDLPDIRMVEGPSSYFLGTDKPLATIVLFSDFSCPFSKMAAETIGALTVIYGGDIKIISRDLPVISDNSLDLALVTRCAGEQEKYWQMYYQLFERQDDFQDVGIASILQLAGVADTDLFYDCLDNKRYLNHISKDYSDAEFLKIKGTPAWFLDGIKVAEGHVPFDTWKEFLDQYLEYKKYEAN